MLRNWRSGYSPERRGFALLTVSVDFPELDYETDLVARCGQKTLIHETTADYSGAVQEYDQAISIFRAAVPSGRAAAIWAGDAQRSAKPGR
jgi:hypothetical protein